MVVADPRVVDRLTIIVLMSTLAAKEVGLFAQ
jgi:hypothetical protein